MPVKLRSFAVITAASILVVACSSSSHQSSSQPAGSGGTSHTYTIGLLTDYTGAAAAGFKTSVEGVEAGIERAKGEGYTFKYVLADTATSPSQALSAAQKLVEEDHVFAVIAESALTFAAAPFLTSHGVPVLGWPADGPEWVTSKNMFSVQGFQDLTKVSTMPGIFMKKEGVTSVGIVGYSIPSSALDSAKGYVISSQEAGLKAGYVNTTFPLGSTNVQPAAIGMKNAGVDGFIGPLAPNTALLMISALRQEGVNLKAALLGTGYGGDLIQGGPDVAKVAQGVFFYTPFEPAEMQTSATKQLESALNSIGVTGDPTYAEYSGYIAVDLLVQGLKAAGTNPTQGSLINSLNSMTNYQAVGLFGGRGIDYATRATDAFALDDCVYMTQLQGSNFNLVDGADPICGTDIPGKRISGS